MILSLSLSCCVCVHGSRVRLWRCFGRRDGAASARLPANPSRSLASQLHLNMTTWGDGHVVKTPLSLSLCVCVCVCHSLFSAKRRWRGRPTSLCQWRRSRCATTWFMLTMLSLSLSLSLNHVHHVLKSQIQVHVRVCVCVCRWPRPKPAKFASRWSQSKLPLSLSLSLSTISLISSLSSHLISSHLSLTLSTISLLCLWNCLLRVPCSALCHTGDRSRTRFQPLTP